MGGTRRVDHEAAHVTDVRHVAVQLARLNELLAGVYTALHFEGDDRAGADPVAVLLRALEPGAVSKTSKSDRLDFVVCDKVLSNGLRVREMALHPQGERFETLQDQERIERRDRHAEVT